MPRTGSRASGIARRRAAPSSSVTLAAVGYRKNRRQLPVARTRQRATKAPVSTAISRTREQRGARALDFLGRDLFLAQVSTTWISTSPALSRRRLVEPAPK